MHIDWWTLTLQTINVLVLLWLLKRFLMQPVVAMIDARQAAAAKLIADAEAARAAAEAEKRKAEEETARITATRADALRAAVASAETAKSTLLADAQSEAERLRSAANVAIERHRKESEATFAEDAKSLAVDIAAKLVSRLPDEAKVDGFIDGIAGALRTLPPESLAALADAGPIPVKAARPLSGAEAGSIRSALAEVLGRPVEIDVRPDPALIAGLEIQTSHAIVLNSLRADLDRIALELKRHDRT